MKKNAEPIFTRAEIAQVLNVTPLTIANREKAEKYPIPKRDLNGYRVYSLNDLLTLQMITYNALDTRPIMSLLYDKGYRDLKQVGQIIDAATNRRKGIE